MEPRARASRHKSSLNFGNELSSLLYATGAPVHPDRANPIITSQNYLANPSTQNKDHAPTSFDQPFPETVRVLDEILTDFIIETCHNAVSIASYSGRAKLKLSDFEWVLRKDSMKLGRVHEMFRKERLIKDSKKLFGNKGEQGKLAVGDLIDLGNAAGEEGTGKGKGRGRGRRKKRDIDQVDGAVGSGGGGRDGRDGEGSMVDGDDLSMDEDEPVAKKVKSEVG